jgi:hypothetical protein
MHVHSILPGKAGAGNPDRRGNDRMGNLLNAQI